MKNILGELKFDVNGLMPAITQDYKTDEVLMLAYMNAESLRKTIESGKAHYFSRSRQKLWLKGETSGHFQLVKSISIDCDNDTLLLKVDQIKAACHTGHRSCFFRKMEAGSIKTFSENDNDVNSSSFNSVNEIPEKSDFADEGVLREVYGVISDRVSNPKEGSYTNYLLEKGLDKILKKIGEEASEVIIAAKNKSSKEIKAETADLLYHVMVMLVERGIPLDEIFDELKDRR